MAGFFVIPKKEETLDGVLARYCTMMNYENGNAASIKFFGRKNLPSKLDLPSNLDFLISQISSITNLTKEEIIEKHTLWPFYKTFIPCERRPKIYNRMILGNGAIYSIAGINASKMKKNKLGYYCPLCYKEDQSNYGFAIWRVMHQIPEVQICTKHKCYLIVCPANHDTISRTAYIDLNTLDGLDLTVRVCSCESTISISNKMIRILDGSFRFDIESINYAQLLHNSIYDNARSFKIKQLSSDISAYYISSNFFCDILSKTNWVSQIIKRPKHFFHPLRHLLIYQYLIEAVISKKEINPFGVGPWSCINRACVHYNSFSITTMATHIDKKSGRIIFLFKCDCGMVYSKSSSSEGNSILDKPKIKIWGSVWMSALRNLLDQKYSLREIGRRLGTDAKTIALHASTITNKTQPSSQEKNLINEYRKIWVNEMGTYSANHVSHTRGKLPSIYTYLYRHDRLWLLTTNKMISKKRIETQLKLDWAAIDNDLSNQISYIVSKLKSESYKGRITKNVILNVLNKQSYLINKNKHKLPISFVTVNSKSESKLDYAKRRVDMSIQQLKIGFWEFPKWKVMRKAGINKNSDSAALKYLDTQLEKLAS